MTNIPSARLWRSFLGKLHDPHVGPRQDRDSVSTVAIPQPDSRRWLKSWTCVYMRRFVARRRDSIPVLGYAREAFPMSASGGNVVTASCQIGAQMGVDCALTPADILHVRCLLIRFPQDAHTQNTLRWHPTRRPPAVIRTSGEHPSPGSS
ncbi:hypothetical protein OH76DRAFT_404567 [Lentinus brumalis]|uniref:Uncharacterized protein n=1 Tax=Lentinus brumalis TaxID=2498619 RepID=A0A371DVR6_9APHY|nr:hypothetical protein OH76DRAFT_404567 [Polyporus brumalis]